MELAGSHKATNTTNRIRELSVLATLVQKLGYAGRGARGEVRRREVEGARGRGGVKCAQAQEQKRTHGATEQGASDNDNNRKHDNGHVEEL